MQKFFIITSILGNIKNIDFLPSNGPIWAFERGQNIDFGHILANMSKVNQNCSLDFLIWAKNWFKHVLGRFEHVLGHFRQYQKYQFSTLKWPYMGLWKGSKYRLWPYSGHYVQSGPNLFPSFDLGQKIDLSMFWNVLSMFWVISGNIKNIDFDPQMALYGPLKGVKISIMAIFWSLCPKWPKLVH